MAFRKSPKKTKFINKIKITIMLEGLAMNAVGSAIDNTIGLIAGGIQGRRQMKWQGELMAKQLGLDKLKMEEQTRLS